MDPRQSAEEEIWYKAPEIPACTKRVFNTPETYNILCDFCRCMQNIVAVDGKITQAVCPSCRVKLGNLDVNRCACGTPRYVDAVGAVSALCRDCHSAKLKCSARSKPGAAKPAAKPKTGGAKLKSGTTIMPT